MEAFDYWYILYTERQAIKYEYKKGPIRVKKDNPNLYGAKFNGYGTRRKPAKCRKTAWKRYYKLFPDELKK